MAWGPQPLRMGMFQSFSLNLLFGQTKVHALWRKEPGRAAAPVWLESTT